MLLGRIVFSARYICVIADTNELIINSELEFEDQTEYRQSALQFEDHKEHRRSVVLSCGG